MNTEKWKITEVNKQAKLDEDEEYLFETKEGSYVQFIQSPFLSFDFETPVLSYSEGLKIKNFSDCEKQDFLLYGSFTILSEGEATYNSKMDNKKSFELLPRFVVAEKEESILFVDTVDYKTTGKNMAYALIKMGCKSAFVCNERPELFNVSQKEESKKEEIKQEETKEEQAKEEEVLFEGLSGQSEFTEKEPNNYVSTNPPKKARTKGKRKR